MTDRGLDEAALRYAAELGLPKRLLSEVPQFRITLVDVVAKRLLGAQAGAIEAHELEAVWLALEETRDQNGVSLRQRLGLRGPIDMIGESPWRTSEPAVSDNRNRRFL